MCGIIFVARLDNRPAQKQLLKRYDRQKSRGLDGFGYLTIKQSRNVSKVARFQFEHEAKKKLREEKSTTVLFHHRFPTSTPNLREATHPILVEHEELQYNYYVVHNGVIHNDDELREAHLKLGYAYVTEIQTYHKALASKTLYESLVQYNDSEAFAIDLVRTLEGKQPKCEARGAIAYMVLQTDKSGRAIAWYYGTNGGNPLTVQKDKKYLVIASEGGKEIAPHVCYKMHADTLEVTEVPLLLEGPDNKTRVGFAPHSLGNDDEADYIGTETYSGRAIHHGKERRDGYSLWELEAIVSEIEEDIETAKEEVSEAIAMGLEEEEAQWDGELKTLENRHSKLMELLERKTNKLTQSL